MNKTTAIIVGLTFVALIGGLVAVNAINPSPSMSDRDTEPDQTVEVSMETSSQTKYEDSGVGLSFSYDDTRYHLEVLPSFSSEHVRSIVLTDIDAYEELIHSDVPREGPPTLAIQVYRNEDKERPRGWADSHPHISMIESALSDVSEAVIGGANAIRYTSDGLYPTDTIVVAHGSYVYVLTGSYLEFDSLIRKDFNPFIESVAFIPEAS